MKNVNLKEINEKDVIVEEEINKKSIDKKDIIEKEEIDKKNVKKVEVQKGIDKMIGKKDEIIDEKDIENFMDIEEDKKSIKVSKKSTKKDENKKKTKKNSSSKATQKPSKETKSKSKIKNKSANEKDVNKILDELEKLYPDAKCELNYGTAFELLIATILSAQCTDVRVNKVTSELFKKYNTARDFANLSLSLIHI